MIGQLTSLALMVAALLLVLSLPLGDGDAGKALRRAAAFAFVMAFVPATLRKRGGSQPSAHADRFRHAKRRPEHEHEEHHGHDED